MDLAFPLDRTEELHPLALHPAPRGGHAPGAPLTGDTNALLAGRLLLVLLLLEMLPDTLLFKLVQPLQLLVAEKQLCAKAEAVAT